VQNRTHWSSPIRATGIVRVRPAERAHLGCTFAELLSASTLATPVGLTCYVSHCHEHIRRHDFRAAGTGRIDVRFFQGILAAAIVGGLVCAARANQPSSTDSRAPAASRKQAPRHREIAERSRGELITRAQSPGGNSSGVQAETSIARSRIVLAVYCALIVGASLFGGWLPRRLQISHTRMQVIISVIAGLMLSIGVFHMLPHAIEELGEEGADRAAYGLMAGLVVMFLLLRIFSFHQHSHSGHSAPSDALGHGHPHSDPRGHVCHHDPGETHSAGHSHAAHSLSWVGVCLGMGLHTLIDGLALGASVEADALQGVTGLVGLGTFLAVFLHKPLDSASITSLMAVGGWSSRSQTWTNSAFAVLCPLGAGLFVLGVHEFSGYQSTIVGMALAASAGVFLCIALADLLPEMEFHRHNRVQLTVALIAGIALGWAIHFLEPAHSHDHSHTESTQSAAATRTRSFGSGSVLK
jgi:zinc and cadmium transporter